MSTPLFGKLFAQPVAIDPGTASTRIYTHERGVVLNQPSVVCFRKAGTGATDARPTLEAVGEPRRRCSAVNRGISKPCGRCGTA